MWATRALFKERQPMIKFLGKRHVPKNVDHSAHAHPAAPDHSLPESFAQYRNRATQHGPLGGQQQQTQQQQSAPPSSSSSSSSPAAPPDTQPYGWIGGHSGRSLGSVKPGEGEAWDRDELPARFHRKVWTEAEIEAVDSAGASMWV